jgi:hypothetical protein
MSAGHAQPPDVSVFHGLGGGGVYASLRQKAMSLSHFVGEDQPVVK